MFVDKVNKMLMISSCDFCDTEDFYDIKAKPMSVRERHYTYYFCRDCYRDYLNGRQMTFKIPNTLLDFMNNL